MERQVADGARALLPAGAAIDGKADTELRVGFADPWALLQTGPDVQEFRVLLRKDAAGGNDPTYDLELWETGGATPLATLVSGATLSSDTGVVVSATWDASLLATADGSAVELRVVGHRSGGQQSKRRTVEVGAAEWNAKLQTELELYFLRARYYDPPTGRFIGRDPIEFAQRYAYAGNNPVPTPIRPDWIAVTAGVGAISGIVSRTPPSMSGIGPPRSLVPRETLSGGWAMPSFDKLSHRYQDRMHFSHGHSRTAHTAPANKHWRESPSTTDAGGSSRHSCSEWTMLR